MIIGQDRGEVIANIQKAVAAGDFYAKVELHDPVLTDAEESQITDSFKENHNHLRFRGKALPAKIVTSVGTRIINRDMQIVGAEDLPEIPGGVVITSNHFGPLENTAIRKFSKTVLHKKLSVVSQVTNFAMQGVIGYLMNYADTVPLSRNIHYLDSDFLELLRERTDRGEAVLIYPEQEMWFNYRKPRPPKRGAYLFAAKLNVPIVSCFVELVDTGEPETEEFNKVNHILHVLGVLYPDPEKNPRANSMEMCRRDYEMKKQAYERIYHEPLDYGFRTSDIAGWKGSNTHEA